MNTGTDETLAAPTASRAGGGRARTRTFAFLVPGVAFVAVVALLAVGLGRDPRPAKPLLDRSESDGTPLARNR